MIWNDGWVLLQHVGNKSMSRSQDHTNEKSRTDSSQKNVPGLSPGLPPGLSPDTGPGLSLGQAVGSVAGLEASFLILQDTRLRRIPNQTGTLQYITNVPGLSLDLPPGLSLDSYLGLSPGQAAGSVFGSEASWS